MVFNDRDNFCGNCVFNYIFHVMQYIIYRSHAEFQLNSEPHYPFWYTPAQFKGRLIISKDGSHTEFFELGIPTDQALNIGKMCLLS